MHDLVNKVRYFKIALLLLCTLVPYLEWGKTQSAFLFEIEWLVIKSIFVNPFSIVHPLILLPLFGQLLILVFGVFITRFYPVLFGIILVSALILLILFVGIFSLNILVVVYCIPFVFAATFFYSNRG